MCDARRVDRWVWWEKAWGGSASGGPGGGGGVRRGFEQVTCFKERHGDGGVVRLAASGSGFGDFVMY